MSLSSLNQFPLDPLDDLPPLTEGDLSIDFSINSQITFENTLKDLKLNRPVIPHSDLSIIRNIPKKNNNNNSNNNNNKEKKEKNSIIGSNINSHKLEQLPPKTDPYELVKLCRQGWTLSKGIAKKPVMAKINPVLVQQDINKFSNRLNQAQIKKNQSAGFCLGERYEPSQWPSNDTISLVSSGKKTTKNVLDTPNPQYHFHREPIKGRAVSFPRELRLENGRSRSPGPIYSVEKASNLVFPHHSSPRLDCSGRELLGSIYWDQFNLKSAGNYYHGLESYLNHTTAPAAIPSTSVVLPPKEDSKKTQSMKQQIERNMNPITPLLVCRDESLGKDLEKGYHRSHHRNINKKAL